MKIDAFYSDPHYGHSNIIKYSKRPYKDVHDMANDFIHRYNDVIDLDDLVLWCGDCFYKCSRGFAKDVMMRLKGRKVLIRGNHDLWTTSCYMSLGFDFVLNELVIPIAGIRTRVSHYPYYTPDLVYDTKFVDIMPHYQPNEVLLHGHTHSKTRISGGNSIHVGVDAWDYAPALMTDVEKLILSTRNKDDLI